LETDKATMDVPSPSSGTVASVAVQPGSKGSTGDVIVVRESGEGEEAATEGAQAETEAAAPEAAPAEARAPAGPGDGPRGGRAPAAVAREGTPAVPRGAGGKRVAVLGAGPGGYAAAFRAADLGLDVTLIERWPTLGGVCLNVGCIPSKALLHAARVIDEAKEMSAHGIEFGALSVDRDKLRAWKSGVVGQ